MPPSPQPAAGENPWARPAQDVLRALGVAAADGLDGREVLARRRLFGVNQLRRPRPHRAWRILVDQFASLMVGLLLAAALLAFLFVDWIDGSAIAAVILINTVLGFLTELRAVRSMEALFRLGQIDARVRRSSKIRQVGASELVPGDIVVLEAGDLVTADLRLIQASRLQANESALSGESMPAAKSIEPVGEQAPLAERSSMLYKGTAITRGSAEGVVVATGLATELGRITALVEETAAGTTPLERRLEQLGRRLIWATLALVALIAVAGITAGRDLLRMLETAIALAVATVPEGLPVVATIALARGMWRMARHEALINRLSAVETLGATGVICTDKTGTLTENRMSVAQLVLPERELLVAPGPGQRFESAGARFVAADAPQLHEALEVGALCNNATLGAGPEEPPAGDPMEVALLEAAAGEGLQRAQLLRRFPEERELAFDPEDKMMATFHRDGDGWRVAVKGAPEAVVEACSRVRGRTGERDLDAESRRRWLENNERLGSDGLRVLALATKRTVSLQADPYRELVLLALVGFLDPPRTDVRAALDCCRTAGITVVMVTGDQAVTARQIGRAVGLVEEAEPDVIPGEALRPAAELGSEERERLLRARLFARVSPRQKLDLIALHQANGAVVAMTGDGVNDAPALKKADIGVAMGRRGTQVAREAADMVLKDDAFSSIVVAVEQGRIIFDNIRKFVLYLLSCNVSEVLIVAMATLANAPLPILPLQILFLNLVTDVFPALALGVGPGDPQIMQRPPRKSSEPILMRRHWMQVASYGAAITAAVLGAFAVALLWLELPTEAAITVSFLTLALAQLWHVFNIREADSGFMRNDVVRNPYLWGALALCLGLLAAAVYLPGLARLLELTVPSAEGWLLIGGFSLAPWLVGQLVLTLGGRTRTRRRWPPERS